MIDKSEVLDYIRKNPIAVSDIADAIEDLDIEGFELRKYLTDLQDNGFLWISRERDTIVQGDKIPFYALTDKARNLVDNI